MEELNITKVESLLESKKFVDSVSNDGCQRTF